MLLPSPSLEGSHHLLHGAQPLSFVPFFCGFVYFTVFVRHFLRLVIVTAVFSQSDVTDEFAGQCVLSPRLCESVRVGAGTGQCHGGVFPRPD